MKPALILLGILIVVGLVLYLLDRRKGPVAEEDSAEGAQSADSASAGCADENCSLGDVCIGKAAIACQVEPVTYYDDEELDAYAGRGADEYSTAEEEQWRDVLYTLQPGDLVGWGQSVKKRGITMPAAIHDEFIMLASERGMQ